MDNELITAYHDNGSIANHTWRIIASCNILHREDGPAIIEYYRGDLNCIIYEQWLQNNDDYREEKLPTRVWYYTSGQIKEKWWVNNKIHRWDGPAIIEYDNNGDMIKEQWYINDKKIDPPYDKWPLTKEQQVEMKLKYG